MKQEIDELKTENIKVEEIMDDEAKEDIKKEMREEMKEENLFPCIFPCIFPICSILQKRKIEEKEGEKSKSF